MAEKKTPPTLKPVLPNAGIEAEYRRRMQSMIDAMHKSVLYWIEAEYRKNGERSTFDRSVMRLIDKRMARLTKQWEANFDTMSEKLADHFATSVEKRSTEALKKILKDGGMAVEFRMTGATQSILDATIHQNVSLIKSIPQQYLGQVEGIVMRGVQTGRDIGQVSQDLQARLGVTRRRAGFIARDQISKATTAVNRSRQMEVGIEEGIWRHSNGGHDKRKSHVEASKNNTRFRLDKGWFDPEVGRYIMPGELPNCKCFWLPVIPGLPA